jgi:signal transduction histidine kinase
MNEGAVNRPPLVVLFDPASISSVDHESALRSSGFRVERASALNEALAALRRDDPAALLVVEGRAGPATEAPLCHAARDQGIPVLGLIDHEGDGASLKERVAGYDGWAHLTCPTSDLVARLGMLLNGQAHAARPRVDPIPIDVRLLAMIVHDVRNPLNVIGLTLRVIEQLPAPKRSEIQEDLNFLRDNAGQIEKILGVLSDVCRLGELGTPSPVPIDPRRFVEAVLAERASRPNGKAFPARFVAEPGTPGTVEVDPTHARVALLSALTNAAAAADSPLQVRTSGGNDRWSVSIAVDRAPPSTVHSTDAIQDRFERVIASVAERQGLDVTMAAWIVRRSGGTARFDVDPGRRSTIVLEWPTRPA